MEVHKLSTKTITNCMLVFRILFPKFYIIWKYLDMEKFYQVCKWIAKAILQILYDCVSQMRGYSRGCVLPLCFHELFKNIRTKL